VAARKGMALPDLPLGRVARVAAVEEALPELLEVGFVPGAQVEPRHTGLGGDPRVYEVDGALVALRRVAARRVRVVVAPEGIEAEE